MVDSAPAWIYAERHPCVPEKAVPGRDITPLACGSQAGDSTLLDDPRGSRRINCPRHLSRPARHIMHLTWNANPTGPWFCPHYVTAATYPEAGFSFHESRCWRLAPPAGLRVPACSGGVVWCRLKRRRCKVHPLLDRYRDNSLMLRMVL